MKNIFTENSKKRKNEQEVETNPIVIQQPDINQSVDEQCFEEKIISAQKALEATLQQWTNVSNEEIFEKIKFDIEFGRRYTWLSGKTITEEQKSYFEELGYKVEMGENSFWNNPYTKISW